VQLGETLEVSGEAKMVFREILADEDMLVLVAVSVIKRSGSRIVWR
jgi:hypothetical protein